MKDGGGAGDGLWGGAGVDRGGGGQILGPPASAAIDEPGCSKFV